MGDALMFAEQSCRSTEPKRHRVAGLTAIWLCDLCQSWLQSVGPMIEITY
jgi:hypothetical protein